MVKALAHKVEFSWITPNPIAVIAKKARICYQSEEFSKKTDLEMIFSLLDLGHIPMFDHAIASFDITTNRGVTHELVRHRIGAAYSQESTRYCDYTKERFDGNMGFVPSVKLQEEHLDEWTTDMFFIEKLYRKWKSKGYPAQIARDVLPTGLKTQIGVTMSFTAWFHLFDLRLSKRAHPDMQYVAKKVLDWFLDNPETRPIFIHAMEVGIFKYDYPGE